MKKLYTTPELEVTLLLADDVLLVSEELDKEVDINPDDFPGFWD